MRPRIATEGNVRLTENTVSMLQDLFPDRTLVVVKREFGNARSGSRVYLVQPVGSRGAELPLVIKLGSASLIEREWRAYERTRGLLYGMIEIQDVALPRSKPQGALVYPLGGGSIFDVVTLQEISADCSPAEMLSMVGRLFRTLESIHNQSLAAPILWRACYDHLLPPHLLIEVTSIPSCAHLYTITPHTARRRHLRIGDWISLEGFQVVKVDLVRQTVTLNLAPAPDGYKDSYVVRARLPDSAPLIREGEVIPCLQGRVLTTREVELETQVNRVLAGRGAATDPTLTLSNGELLPNPLVGLSRILDQYSNVRLSLIHGDLNLDNVLVDAETGHISLIDVTEARVDHVMHDFLRLETEVVTKLIPETIQADRSAPDLFIREFYCKLHCSVFQSDSGSGWVTVTPELKKPYQVIQAIRRTARRHLYAGSSDEYYQGLLLYLIGALKFSNLEKLPSAPLPKQLAFWGAATIYSLLKSAVDCDDYVVSQVSLPKRPHALVIDYRPEVRLQRNGSDHLVAVEYGTRLYRGDTIHTYTDGYALVHCSKGPSFPIPSEHTKTIDCDRVSKKGTVFQPDPCYQDSIAYLVDGLTTYVMEPAQPSSPLLFYPRNTCVATCRPSFRWHSIPGARGYRLELRMPGGQTWSRETSVTTMIYPDDVPTLVPGSNNTVVLTALGTGPLSEVTQLQYLDAQDLVTFVESEAKLRELSPDDSAHGYLLSRLCRRWKMWGPAAEALEQVTEVIGPVAPYLLLELAELHTRMGLYSSAQKTYERVLSAVASHGAIYGEACLGLAYVHRVRGNVTEAVIHLQRAVQTEYSELAQSLIQHLTASMNGESTYVGPVRSVDYVQYLAEQIAPALKQRIRSIAVPFLARLSRVEQLALRSTGTGSLAPLHSLGSGDFEAMSVLAAAYLATVTLIDRLDETDVTSAEQSEHLVDLVLTHAKPVFAQILGTDFESMDMLVEQYASLTAATPDILRCLIAQESK